MRPFLRGSGEAAEALEDMQILVGVRIDGRHRPLGSFVLTLALPFLLHQSFLLLFPGCDCELLDESINY